MKFDVPYIRRQFPALERTIDGRPVAYFDSPGGTQVPQRVLDAVTDYLVNHNSNTHGFFAATIETDHLLADARDALADSAGLRLGRGRLRRQHDDPELPARPQPRARPQRGRRGRHHRARPRGQPRPLALAPGTRRGGARGARRSPGPAHSTGRPSPRSSTSAPASSPRAGRTTPSARSTTSPASWPWPVPSAR